jgi:hypothetical protein
MGEKGKGGRRRRKRSNKRPTSKAAIFDDLRIYIYWRAELGGRSSSAYLIGHVVSMSSAIVRMDLLKAALLLLLLRLMLLLDLLLMLLMLLLMLLVVVQVEMVVLRLERMSRRSHQFGILPKKQIETISNLNPGKIIKFKKVNFVQILLW